MGRVLVGGLGVEGNGFGGEILIGAFNGGLTGEGPGGLAGLHLAQPALSPMFVDIV